MNSPLNKTIDVENWPRDHSGNKHPIWWGILSLITIECCVVAIFCAGYFYLWMLNLAPEKSGWPPPGTQKPDIWIPSINVALLLFCAWTMYYGGRLIERNQTKKFSWMAFYCCLSSLIILGLRLWHFHTLPFDHTLNAYASYLWLLTGFHFVHVASAMLGTAVIGVFAWKGFYTPERALGVNVDTLYWYFVVLAWLPIYLLLYILPHFDKGAL